MGRRPSKVVNTPSIDARRRGIRPWLVNRSKPRTMHGTSSPPTVRSWRPSNSRRDKMPALVLKLSAIPVLMMGAATGVVAASEEAACTISLRCTNQPIPYHATSLVLLLLQRSFALCSALLDPGSQRLGLFLFYLLLRFEAIAEPTSYTCNKLLVCVRRSCVRAYMVDILATQ